MIAEPRAGETPLQALRHHLLTAVIDRVARTSADFVLRGGMATRAWVAPHARPTRDLDYVGDFAFDVADTVRRFAPALALALDDGVRIDASRLVARGIWLDTAFPGVHLDLAIGLPAPDQMLGVDIGFGDPLVPPAVTWPSGVRACRPETQLGWKLHCLAEFGEQWRPKDVADLWLIATRVELEPAAMTAAIAAAFTSRGYSLASARTVLEEGHWATKSARVRWASGRMPMPALADVIAGIRARLAPVLEELS